MRNTLTKPFVCAFNALALLFTLASANAGSPDFSKATVQPMAPACDPRWYISIGGGIDLDYQATNFVDGTDFGIVGSPGDSESYKSRTYDDVFGDTLYRIQGEIGYVLNDHIELFGLFKYAGGYGNPYVDRDVEGNFDYAVFVYPGDYRSWGGELGARYFFLTNKEPWHVRPYVSISGGATYVESISVEANYGYSAGYLPAYKGKLYDSTVVGTGALMIGLEVPINCHWSFGVEGGVRYESPLDGTDVVSRTFTYYDTSPVTPGTYTFTKNPGHYNDAGDRLYFPANVYVKFRF